MNYKGNCSVKIRHICREDLTFVETMEFEFMDGERFFSSCQQTNLFLACLTMHDLS